MVSGKEVTALIGMATITIAALALWNVVWTARPIIDYSIYGFTDSWHISQGNMTIYVQARNRGMDDALSLLIVKTINAKIINPVPASNDTLLKDGPILLPKSMTTEYSIPITIMPDSNTHNFTVSFSLMDGSSSLFDVPNHIASYNQLSTATLTYNMTDAFSYTLAK